MADIAFSEQFSGKLKKYNAVYTNVYRSVNLWKIRVDRMSNIAHIKNSI